ncbi:MAG TPA: hypothetical protein VK338_03235 [Candidatus Nitrosocosmicus sp.]|nr:hypothetical protein [Candidatus Nitrosocosmicus sp.]
MQKVSKIISIILGLLIISVHIPLSNVHSATTQTKKTGKIFACFNYNSCERGLNKSIRAYHIIPTITPTITIKPTATNTPVLKTKEEPTATINPTSIPTITPTTIPTQIPTQFPVAGGNFSTSASADRIFELINAHRASISLPAFEKEERLCQLAVSRGPELAAEAANGNYHAGLYARNLPYWITENMAFYQTVEQNMNFWLNSSIHRAAIQGNYRYSCGYCEGNICIQLFTNYTPK